jgi:predicted signal transduction protein with EAL and GGDEF domain
VARALKETGLPPRLLELEITESTAMQQTDIALRTLKRLKQLGVSIAIDDFGTGYSSLSYLRRFPVDKLKIDRSFITELPGDRDQGAIVSAIVALAHALRSGWWPRASRPRSSASSSAPAAATSSRATWSASRSTPTPQRRNTSSR